MLTEDEMFNTRQCMFQIRSDMEAEAMDVSQMKVAATAGSVDYGCDFHL